MEDEQVIPASETPEPDNQELSSMNKLLLPLFIILVLVIGAAAFFIGSQKQKVSQSPTPTPTEEAVQTSEPSPSGSPRATQTPSPTPTPIAFRVTAVVAAVAPISSNVCPTTFNFSGTITTNLAGTVNFKWERSDGASGISQSLVFDSAGSKTVTTSWQLSNDEPPTKWEKLHVLSPNDISSNEATFTLNCP